MKHHCPLIRVWKKSHVTSSQMHIGAWTNNRPWRGYGLRGITLESVSPAGRSSASQKESVPQMHATKKKRIVNSVGCRGGHHRDEPAAQSHVHDRRYRHRRAGGCTIQLPESVGERFMLPISRAHTHTHTNACISFEITRPWFADAFLSFKVLHGRHRLAAISSVDLAHIHRRF